MSDTEKEVVFANALDKWIKDNAYSNADVSELLLDVGIDITRQAVLYHRKNKCEPCRDNKIAYQKLTNGEVDILSWYNT